MFNGRRSDVSGGDERCRRVAKHSLAIASSHIGSAEKQFRFPLEYGNQRPLSATWTVTGSGGFIVSKKLVL